MAALKWKGIEKLKVPAQAQKDALRDGTRAAGHHFKQEMLPVRFTKRAIKLLGYSPRSGDPGSGRAFRGSYQWKKLKRFKNGQGIRAAGEVKPFVWSGETRGNAKSRSRVKAIANSATKGRFEVIAPVQRINHHPKYLEEFKRIAASEEKRLSNIFARFMGRSLLRRLNRKR